MALVTQKLEILADPAQPSAEVANIISAFLRFHSGKEAQILTEIKAEIDAALAHFTPAQSSVTQPHAK